MNKRYILDFAPEFIALREDLANSLGISSILAQILINRGITTLKEAESFLNPSLDDLLNPYDFKQMKSAVSLTKSMLNKKILIFGDYDVDGIVGSVLLKETFRKLNKDVPVYIPHRVNEGYGLNKTIINFIKENNINLLITVDCGTNDNQRIRELINRNIKVIVLDHHQPKEETFNYLIINPKLKDSGYKFKYLSASAVAYKFCQALLNEPLYEDLDLVSLATVADAMPIIGENRVIVKEGLKRIYQTEKLGLKALLRVSGLEERNLNTYSLAYILAPRINASGRIDSAEISLKLLLTKDKTEANLLAEEIQRLNSQRQRIENNILEEALELIEREVNFKEERVIVLAQEGWHPGVLGIVASRIVERYYRPAVVISLDQQPCRGSARSIKDFSILEALLGCKEFLADFGGHSLAAGLTIDKESIGKFREEINFLAKKVLTFEKLIPKINIDMKLKLKDLNLKVARELDMLEPFGEENPKPLFYTENLRLKGKVTVLRKNTIKFWLTDGLVTYPAIVFGRQDLRDYLEDNEYFNLVYSLGIDDYNEEPSLILEAEEFFSS